MTLLRTRPGFFVVTLAFLLSSTISFESPHAQSTPGPYTLIDLGTLGGGSARANDMNENGQITGYAIDTAGRSRAFLWDDGHMTDLGTLGGPAAIGLGINGLGHVVGYSNLVPAGASVAALWRDGAVINMTPDLAAGQGSSARAINDSGQAVVQISYGDGFLWENGVRTPLGDLGGGFGSVPQDINNAGQIVGSASTTITTDLGPMAHAFLWQNGAMTDLGVLPGDEDSGASAINSLGVIVGSSGRTDPDTYQQFYKPFIYQNGQMTAIPVPGTESFGGDINDLGHVVGTMRASGAVTPWHAWIYKDGVVTNLNSVKPTGTGLHLAFANAINNAGQITGVAMDAQGRYHGFLLTPCDDACGPPPAVPSINITDVTKTEGNSGTTNFAFAVSLSAPTTATVRVNFMTANLKAVAGVDYNFANGTLIFSPGQTSKTVNVAVKGDRSREQDETFRVNLSAADGGTILDSFAVGTIRNDDK
jgi:probable HAF family extracellular repeat protein